MTTPVVSGSIDWDSWTPGSIPAARQAAKLDGLIATAVGRNPGWSDRAATRGSLLASIEDHRLDRLAAAVADAVARGDSSDTLAKVLRGVLDDPKWADLVATTEMNRAMSAASLASYTEAGIEGKSWLTSSDDMVCEPCTDNEAAGPIPLDALFPSGDDASPAHGRCRCCVLPETVVPADAVADSDANPLLPTIPSVPAHPTAGNTRNIGAVDTAAALPPASGTPPGPPPPPALPVRGSGPDPLRGSAIQNHLAALIDLAALIADERQAIYDYTTPAGYRTVNRALRGEIPSTPRSEEITRLIDAIFAKVQPAGQTFIVNRAVRHVYRLLPGVDATGMVIEDPGFLSTSARPDEVEAFIPPAIPGPAIFEIEVPAGAKALPVELIGTSFPDQQEILLPRGTRLEITSDEIRSVAGRDVRFLKARVLP